MTATLAAQPSFDLHLPAFGRPGWGDLPDSLVIAPLAAALGMCAVCAFRTSAASSGASGTPWWRFPSAGSFCGFRGGRILPAVFVGAAFGLGAHALLPVVHPALGVAMGVLGMLLAVTRQGWVSLFTAAVPVASPAAIAVLCFASPPAWLLVTGRPRIQLREDGTPVR